MTADQRSLITQLLQHEINTNTANLLYLRHQKSLSPEHRVTELNSDNLDEGGTQLEDIVNKYKEALKAFQEY